MNTARYYLGWFQSMGYAAMGCGLIVYIEPSGNWKVAFKRARTEVAKRYSAAFYENDCDAIFRVPHIFLDVPDEMLEQYYLNEKCPTTGPGKPMINPPDWWWTRYRDTKRLLATLPPAQPESEAGGTMTEERNIPAPLSDCLRLIRARHDHGFAPAEERELEEAASLLDLAWLALGELTQRIERCGASIELTNAVTLCSDLRMAFGNRWNARDKYAEERVRKELPPVQSGKEAAQSSTGACHHGWRGSSIDKQIQTPCPACGQKSLFIGDGGHLTCARVPSDHGDGCHSPSVEETVANLKAEIRDLHAGHAAADSSTTRQQP
mgnify:CR=1 FL=1